MKKIFLLCCFVLFTVICFAQTNIDKLRWIEKANAVVDASKSIGEKDFRFLGIAGYAITFPGIPQEKQDELIRKFGYKIIEGTSDVVEGEEHLRLINLAESYAEAYNAAVLKHLASDAPSPHAQKHNVIPENGYVPDEETAIGIAVAVWIPIYGKKQIESKKPFKAVLKNDVWHIEGSLPMGWLGGVPEAEIDKKTGRIIRISHGE